MHKVNSRWGPVEVRYTRTDDGSEILSVPSVTTSLADWNKSKTGPPPFLVARDLSTTGDWCKHLTLALVSDIESDKPKNVKPAILQPVIPPVPQRRPALGDLR